MTALHELLDDAADRALAGVPAPDPQAALALARRDRVSRNRFRAATLVAAAVLAVLATAALLTGSPLVQRSAPASGPTGIPQRWWTPPEWTPSVVGRPIAAAGLLLDTAVVAPDQSHSTSVLFERGVVAVSADGAAYRRVPTAGSVAVLSPSGRYVAWVEGSTPPGRTRLVVLDVPTGNSRTTRLPDGAHAEVASLSWLPRDAGVVVSTELDAPQSTTGAWRVDLGGRVTTICRCGSGTVVVAHPTTGPVVLGAGTSGVWGVPGARELQVDDARRSRAERLGRVLALVGPSGIAFSPDGSLAAVVPGTVTEDPADDVDLLIVGQDGRTRTTRLPGFTGLRVLGWTARGVVLAGTPAGDRPGLWLVDPDGSVAPARISTGDRGAGFGPARVVALAADVAESGGTVPGVEPDRSHRSVAYLRYRVEASVPYRLLTDGQPPRWLVLTGTVLVLEGLRRLHLRGRRRAGRKPAG